MNVSALQANLRKIRLYANIEQQDLAAEINVTRQTINNIETGKSVLTYQTYNKIVTYISKVAMDGKTELIPFIQFLQNDKSKNITWGELEMSYRIRQVHRGIEQMKQSGLNRDILEKIQNTRGVYCKYLAFTYQLWNQMLREIEYMLSNLEDLSAVNRYFLKPYVENYINFRNLVCLGEDYVRAMQIHFLNEDKAVQYKFFGVYNEKLGIDVENRSDLERKQEKHFYRIEQDLIVNAIKKTNYSSHTQYYFPMKERQNLYKHYVDDTDELIELCLGLYDFANNHGHMNLRFLRQADQDIAHFSHTLLSFLDNTITTTTRELLRIYRFREYNLEFEGMLEGIDAETLFKKMIDNDFDEELDLSEDEEENNTN
ncbi:Helix-turn-helix domain protein [compost metagenome]